MKHHAVMQAEAEAPAPLSLTSPFLSIPTPRLTCLFMSIPNPTNEQPSSHIFSYKDKVKDYNFGSLIRTDARDEYGEKNTIFGMFTSLSLH